MGNNGKTLRERMVPRQLSNAATALVASLRINSVSEQNRRNGQIVVKCRNGHSEQIAEMANLYFSWTGLPIRFWSKVEQWQRWEVESFNMLNGDQFKARPVGARKVIEDKLPGESLWDQMNRGTLTQPMLVAAARELRRAHQFWSDEFAGPWSHGDATTTNVIYNSQTDRARWLDFEILHEKSLSPEARHADDLLVFLLDMAGIVSSRQWLPFAICFLEAYGEREIIRELRRQLPLPGGLAWIWWEVRTNFAPLQEIKQRLDRLATAIERLEIYRPTSGARVRRKRRASIICQATTAGMPMAQSRTRAIKEMAKAASPGM